MRKVSLLQVGLSGMGSLWWQILSEHPCYDVIGVVENDEQIYEQFHSMGFPIFKNYLDGLDKVHCDAALICTPADTHKPYAVTALRAHRHVIMEKPLASTMAEARLIRKTAQSSERICMVCQNYRYGPVAMAVKKAIDEKVVGDIEYGEYSFHKNPGYGGWAQENQEPLLDEMAIQHFDMLRFLVGSDVVRVYASSWHPSWSEYQGNLAASALLEFENGVNVAYSASWVSRGEETGWNGRLRLVGSGGEIYIPDEDMPYYVLAGAPSERHFLPLVPYYPTGQHGLLYTFYKAFAASERPSTDVDDNIKSFAICASAVQSANTRRAIAVKV